MSQVWNFLRYGYPDLIPQEDGSLILRNHWGGPDYRLKFSSRKSVMRYDEISRVSGVLARFVQPKELTRVCEKTLSVKLDLSGMTNAEITLFESEIRRAIQSVLDSTSVTLNEKLQRAIHGS